MADRTPNENANERARAAKPDRGPNENASDQGKLSSAKHDAGREQVKEQMDEITEQGFRGVKVDPTPNENYTVAGVTADAPTPETDVDAEAAAAEAAGSHGTPLADAVAANQATLDEAGLKE